MNFVESIKSIFRNYGDFIFFFVSVILGSVIYFILKANCLITQDIAQILVVYATFVVIFHSVFIKDNFAKYREKPIISVEFIFKEPDCHLTNTIVPIGNGAGLIVPTYYIRMRIKNTGKTTLTNAEVVVEKVKKGKKTLSSFLPLNLTWALTEVQKNRGLVNIPQGAYRTVDLISIGSRDDLANVWSTLKSSNSITADRYKAMIGSIHVCSVVEPNTMSDILPKGNYTFYLTVISDNHEPFFVKLSIKYDGRWDTNIKKMFKSHLRVTHFV